MAKVLVGLSGGVDSAVAAYLLLKEGHDVQACFMRNWDSALNNDTLGNPTLNDDICPQEADYNDAKKVADILNIELYRRDYISEYWDEVFKTFLSEYQKGRTPNPDILCNRYIKFAAFLDFAKEQGFDYIATGHYVKKGEYEGRPCLLKAHDFNKDQSYFLAEINKEVLKYCLFPLGEIDKGEVRKIAEELDLPIAHKKDSTGICFIGERNFRAFLSNYLPMQDGDIIDLSENKVIGRHHGVFYYTIGQRKGLGIGGEGGPYYVAGKDIYKNELYVVNVDHREFLYATSVKVIGFNYLIDLKSKEFDCQAKFRYRAKDSKVHVKILEDHLLIECLEDVKAITEGQEAVLYLGDVLIGGGVIEEVYFDGITRQERIKNLLGR